MWIHCSQRHVLQELQCLLPYEESYQCRDHYYSFKYTHTYEGCSNDNYSHKHCYYMHDDDKTIIMSNTSVDTIRQILIDMLRTKQVIVATTKELVNVWTVTNNNLLTNRR